MKHKLFFWVTVFLIFGCTELRQLQPTPTLTPSPFPTTTITPTSISVSTSTPDLVAQYLPFLPQKPSGFEWKIVPDLKLAVLIPDGWFFKKETRTQLGFTGFYVTKENIDEAGRFSNRTLSSNLHRL